jgi:hypothetical protein
MVFFFLHTEPFSSDEKEGIISLASGFVASSELWRPASMDSKWAAEQVAFGRRFRLSREVRGP